ncbi:MAG: YhbY family RNA-binding protein [Clostridia bacterium]
MINAKERSFLKSKANTLKPLVYIGKDGLNDNIINEINISLFHNELIKIAVLKSCVETAKDLSIKIETKLFAETVQVLGSKITLYKVTEKEGFEHLLATDGFRL